MFVSSTRFVRKYAGVSPVESDGSSVTRTYSPWLQSDVFCARTDQAESSSAPTSKRYIP